MADNNNQAKTVPQFSFIKTEEATDSGKGKKYTNYVIQFEVDYSISSVRRRFSSLEKLHEELTGMLPANADKASWPAFPPKKTFGNKTADFVAQRQAELEKWANSLALYIAKPELQKLQSRFYDFFVDTDIAQGVQNLHLNDPADKDKLLNDMQSLLSEEHKRDAKRNELVLFLRDASWDPKVAATRYSETRIWRQKMNLEKLTIRDVQKQVSTGKFFVQGNCRDKQNRPIVVFKSGLHVPDQTNTAEMVQLLLYVFETALKQLGDKTEDFVFVLDMKGQSMMQNDFRTSKAYWDIFANYYPGRIGPIFVLNAPWFYKVVWKVFSLWMSTDFASKVRIYYSDLSPIQEFIAPDQLLPEHGGTNNFTVQQWMEDRAKAEGVQLANLSEAAANASSSVANIDETLLATLTDVPAVAVSVNALKTGWLSKEGGVVKNYKKRYMVLTKGLLYYYKGDKEPKPQGVVILERAEVADSQSPAHSFKVVTPNRTYLLIAENDGAKKEWVDAISHALVKLNA